MVKHQRKEAANFKSIYGGNLILNMSTSSGCFQVSIKEPNEFSKKSIVFIGCTCAIGLLRSLLDINTSLIIIGLLFVLYILYESFFFIEEEKILIIKGFGCYISKKYWFGKRTIFIPYEQIQKVFINEVIFRHRVIYLLTLLTQDWTKENENKLVPLFLNLLPRIDCLQIIYKNIKCLEGR